MSPGGATSPAFGLGAAAFPLPDEPHATAISVSPASSTAAHGDAPRISDVRVTTARRRYAAPRNDRVRAGQSSGKSTGPAPTARDQPSYARRRAAPASPLDRRGRRGHRREPAARTGREVGQ